MPKPPIKTQCQEKSVRDQPGKDWLAEKTDWLEAAELMENPMLESRDFWKANSLKTFSRRPGQGANLESMSM